jgi:hypothetical protein
MRFRFSMTCALGLAAALVTFDASQSYAQAPTDTAAARRRAAARRAAARRAAAARARSERQIPTTGKEVPVQTVTRVDTVYQVRSDTVYRMRTDTVTVRSVDTVTVQQPPVFPTGRLGGFYFGVAGGLAAPRQQLNTIFEPGYEVGGFLGWDMIGSPFGIRVDAAYDQFSERPQFAGLATAPKIIAVHGDGKLKFPLFGMETGGRGNFYAVGGVSWLYNKNLLYAPAATPCCGGVNGRGDIEEWKSNVGWNAGLGLGFGFGPTDMFLEARWVQVAGSRSYAPIVLGVMF